MKLPRIALPLTCLIAAGLSPASGQINKLSTDLQALLANPLGLANVILQYNSAPSFLDLTQITLLGGSANAQCSNLAAVAAKLPLANILTLLLADLNITHVSLDRPLGGTLDYSSAAVNAGAATQYGLDGTGVGIAVIDSGISPHADLMN